MSFHQKRIFISAIYISSLLASFLAGCGPKPYTGDSPYGKWLVAGESVDEVVEDGPFRMLHIDYRTGSSYITSEHSSYYRILYQDRIFLDNVTRAGHWDGIAPAFFVEIYDNGYTLNVVHAESGKPVIQHIEPADLSWLGEEGYEYGYPLRPNLLYFPPLSGTLGNGFLLSMAPLVVTRLPRGVLGGVRAPKIQIFAGFAPDAKSVAFVDAEIVPDAMMVIDADRRRHDPIPIPIMNGAAFQKFGTNSADRVVDWFSSTYAWRKSSLGTWEAMQPSAVLANDALTNPVEELFIDADLGYQTCFDPNTTYCVPKWQRVMDNNTRTSIADGFNPAFAYAPTDRAQAFGADVLRLNSSYAGRANYALHLNASAETITADFIARLNDRKIPYVRTDQCPLSTGGQIECTNLLKKKLGWKIPVDREVLLTLDQASPSLVIFILPSLAVTIFPREGGTSFIQTVARYNAEGQRSHVCRLPCEIPR